MNHLKLEFLTGDFSVCRLDDPGGIDMSKEVFFLAKTPDEVSLVCASADVPEKASRVEAGWRMFRIGGRLDFGLVGILARITGILAEHGISVFAVSTFDTDYIMIKELNLATAQEMLARAGYQIER